MVKNFFLNKEISHKYLNFRLLTSSAPFGPIFPQWQREVARPQGRRAPCPQATAASLPSATHQLLGRVLTRIYRLLQIQTAVDSPVPGGLVLMGAYLPLVT